MAQPVSMKRTIQAVRDANTVVSTALRGDTAAEVTAAAVAVVLREFLDNEYVNDLDHGPVEERRPRPVAR